MFLKECPGREVNLPHSFIFSSNYKWLRSLRTQSLGPLFVLNCEWIIFGKTGTRTHVSKLQIERMSTSALAVVDSIKIICDCSFWKQEAWRTWWSTNLKVRRSISDRAFKTKLNQLIKFFKPKAKRSEASLSSMATKIFFLCSFSELTNCEQILEWTVFLIKVWR